MLNKKLVIIVIIAIMLISIFTFISLFNFIQPTGRFVQPTISNDEIINKIKIFPEVSEYSTMPATVNFISLDELNSLAKKYPVIYGNVSKAVYEVRFSSGNSGLLVLYDSDSNKILKQFEIVGVSIV